MTDPAYLWAHYDPQNDLLRPRFEFPVLAFAIFTPDNTISSLNNSLSAFLHPFVHYPWFYGPPKSQIFRKNASSYIYGELTYGENTSDEWLLIFLLWKFSESHPDAYIHLIDSVDRDVLLVAHYKVLPDWIGPENARNRAWINHGSLKLVQLEEELISLQDAVLLIESSSEKLRTDKDLTNSILAAFQDDAVLQTYNTNLVYELQLELPAPIASFISTNPWVLSRSIENFCKNDLSPVAALSALPTLMDGDSPVVSTAISLPILTLSLLRGVKEQLRRDQPHIATAFRDHELVSRVVLAGLDSLVQYDPELVRGLKSTKSATLGSSRERLLRELHGLFAVPEQANAQFQLDPQDCFKDSIFEQFSAPDEESDVPEEKIAEFFKDTQAGLEGIGNDPEKERSDRLQALSGIDDDFFEFYARTYMQLSDDELQQYANAKKNGQKRTRKTSQLKEYNDDSDYHTDTSVEYGLDDEGSEEALDEEGLLEAIRQFKMTASDNPLARSLLINGIGGK